MWAKAVHYLRESGARAITRSAYIEALAGFEAALAAAEHLPADRHLTELMVDIRFDIRSALWPLVNSTELPSGSGRPKRTSKPSAIRSGLRVSYAS